MADVRRFDEERLRRLGKRILVGAAIVAGVVVTAFVFASFAPRWWSHRIGDQARDSITVGILLGLFYGFFFTVLPLLVAWIGFRKRRPYKVWALYFVTVVLLALPNLLTLGIVLGSGSGAHAGERTLDVEAPGFRGATLFGTLLALGLAGLFAYQLINGKVLRRRLGRLSRLLDVGDDQPEPVQPVPAPAPVPPANGGPPALG